MKTTRPGRPRGPAKRARRVKGIKVCCQIVHGLAHDASPAAARRAARRWSRMFAGPAEAPLIGAADGTERREPLFHKGRASTASGTSISSKPQGQRIGELVRDQRADGADRPAKAVVAQLAAMLKPRPSEKAGKRTATRLSRPCACSNSAAFTSFGTSTPMRWPGPRLASAAGRSAHATMTGRPAGVRPRRRVHETIRTKALAIKQRHRRPPSEQRGMPP